MQVNIMRDVQFPRTLRLNAGNCIRSRSIHARTLKMGPSTQECVKMGPSMHAGPATGAFGGAPYGGTKRVRGVPKWTRVRMRALPLGPLVELPLGPRNV